MGERSVTRLIDTATGTLTIEGMSAREIRMLAGDIWPTPEPINCGRPGKRNAIPGAGAASQLGRATLTARLYRVYHGAVSEGPGRRSVIQLQGCPIRCPGCYVPATHDLAGGDRVSVRDIAAMALAPEGDPRDGVTILGGEPFAQPAALAAIARILKSAGEHLTIYTGYTLEQLCERPESAVAEALRSADLLIDGPYKRNETAGAGEYRGSRNQRMIEQPGRYLRCVGALAAS